MPYSQGNAAQQGHADLLPEHPGEIAELHIPQGDAADDGNGALAAGVTAGIHEHGNKGDEGGREGLLKAEEDHAGKGSGNHEQEQPRDTAFPGFKDPGAQIGLIAGGNGGHFFHILGGFIGHNVDHVIDGDDAHQAIFVIHHGHGKHIIFGKHQGDLFLVVMGMDADDVGAHDIPNHGIRVRQDELP